jgi:hypothetical protein
MVILLSFCLVDSLLLLLYLSCLQTVVAAPQPVTVNTASPRLFQTDDAVGGMVVVAFLTSHPNIPAKSADEPEEKKAVVDQGYSDISTSPPPPIIAGVASYIRSSYSSPSGHQINVRVMPPQIVGKATAATTGEDSLLSRSPAAASDELLTLDEQPSASKADAESRGGRARRQIYYTQAKQQSNARQTTTSRYSTTSLGRPKTQA